MNDDMTAKVVDAGVAVLDKTVPDWRSQVDPGTLAVWSELHCVAAQLATAEELADEECTPYVLVISRLSGFPLWDGTIPAEVRAWSQEHGFDSWETKGVYAIYLQLEWLRRLKESPRGKEETP